MAIARYVQERKKPDGKTMFYFSPPSDVLKANFIRPEPLGTDRERARLRAMHLNNQIDAWRNGNVTDVKQKVIVRGTVDELFDKYLRSRYFLMDLKSQTQNEYRRELTRASEIEIEGYRFGSLRLSELKHRHGDTLYDITLSDRGIVGGYRMVTTLRRVFNIGMRWDMVPLNPFAKLEVKFPEGRSAIWQPEQVESFCDAAVDAGKTSMARIMRLAYDTAQRRVDLISLRKSAFDPETNILTVKQSKTGHEVYIPLAPLFRPWFTELPKDDSFVFLNEGTGEPYSLATFTKTFRKICDDAKLPSNLQFRDIRRTVATELGDAGATEDELMSIGGWKSRQVVSVYTKKTIKQAVNAVEKLRKARTG